VPEVNVEYLTLPPALTVATVARVREQALERLGGGQVQVPFVVDASSVDTIDAAGIQVLVALARECSARQGTLSILAPSPALEDALGLLGLDASLVA